MSEAVRVDALTVTYGNMIALDEITLHVPPGQALGIVGPNGSGKSTLLKTIAGLVRPASGKIEVLGSAPGRTRAGMVGYVPQIEEVDWAFPATVRDVVAMGRFPRIAPFARFSSKDAAQVERAMAAVQIEHLARRPIAQLSGGQQQRTFVARALAQEPELLLLDEPTTGVDATTESALREVVRALVAAGMPVLMTTHDMEAAEEWFDRLIVLDKKVLADGVPRKVLESGAYAGIREHTHTHGHPRVDTVRSGA